MISKTLLRQLNREIGKIYDLADRLLLKLDELEQKEADSFTPDERQLSVRLDRSFALR